MCNVAAGTRLQYSLDAFSVTLRGPYTDVADGGGHNILVSRRRGFSVLDTSKVSKSSSSVRKSGYGIGESVRIEGSGFVWSIQKSENCTYTLCEVSGQVQVVVFDANTNVEVKRWPVPELTLDVARLAVYDEKVYIVDEIHEQLRVFSTDGKHLANIRHSSFIWPSALSVCPPHSIIICDPSANRVHKLDTRTHDIIWSSTAVKSPSTVCCDDTRGEVWVWSSDTKSLFILDSETGMQLVMLYYILISLISHSR